MRAPMKAALSISLVTAVALFGAACGDDDDSGDTNTTDTETSQTETNDDADDAAEDAAEPADADDSAGSSDAMELEAEVGPGFDITLKDDDGKTVTSIPAGTYEISVEDKSDQHNFHLTGDGVDETTSVDEVTETTWTVTFTKGEYTYICDPHPDSMKETFEVT